MGNPISINAQSGYMGISSTSEIPNRRRNTVAQIGNRIRDPPLSCFNALINLFFILIVLDVPRISIGLGVIPNFCSVHIDLYNRTVSFILAL